MSFLNGESFKKLVKMILPEFAIQKLREIKIERLNANYKRIFSDIYESGTWGKSQDPTQLYYSGTGSHDQHITYTYVSAVESFLQTLPRKPDVIDLGCGDFSVGSRIRPFCGRYVACDIVPELVDFNKKRFDGADVEFRVLDLIKDEIPTADVAFIRQVLQHLSNSHIKRIIPKIQNNFKYLIVTEHLPSSKDFPHNIDHPTGASFRLGINSGVVLTSPPFGLLVKRTQILCEAKETGGTIQTLVYTLKD